MSQLCVDARRNGTYVLLGGDCADEYFSGYSHYEACFDAFSPPLAAPTELTSLDSESAFYVAEHAEGYEAREREVRRRILERLADVEDPREKYVQATLLHDTSTFLQTCNLPHSDAFSMMASVELRNPMLDVDLVRFVVNLPEHYKARWHASGHFGKCLMRDLVSREIGEFVNVKKEGTRNFAMKMANMSYWRVGQFAVQEMLPPIPEELTARQMIRLINLEIFHRQFFLGEDDFLPKIMTPMGLSEVAPGPRLAQAGEAG